MQIKKFIFNDYFLAQASTARQFQSYPENVTMTSLKNTSKGNDETVKHSYMYV